MKRNWDIIRAILIDTEKETIESAQELKKYEKEDIKYNASLLVKGNFIEGYIIENSLYPSGIGGGKLVRLTWEGHNLLDSLRTNKTWDKMKEIARDKGIEITFDTIKLLFRSAVETLF